MTYSFTGHRPPKLGGYGIEARNRLHNFALQLIPVLEVTYGPVDHIITGMALGWDTAIASAARELEIPYSAAVPCMTQASQWPIESQDIWQRLIDDAIEVVPMGDTYHVSLMQIRNQWMVDNSDRLIALWDGSPGGTANCVRYAHSIKHPVNNAWKRWTGSTL